MRRVLCVMTAAAWLLVVRPSLGFGQSKPAEPGASTKSATDSDKTTTPATGQTTGAGQAGLPALGPPSWHLGKSIWGEQDWRAAVEPPGQFLGPFGGVDLGLMQPHLRIRLGTPLNIAPTGRQIPLPVASYDW